MLKKIFTSTFGRRLFQLRERERGEIWLSQRRVFILPSRAGVGFGFLLLVLFIGAINYNLGLGFALTFFAAGCALVDMYLTTKNLAGLHLAPGRAQPVFPGEEARFELNLINRSKRDRFAIHIDFLHLEAARHVVDVAAGNSTQVTLGAPAARRGWLEAPRVRLAASFPLGLFRSWCYWKPESKVLVYPLPEQDGPPLPLSGGSGEPGAGHAGEEDFAGIRSYQQGDPMRRLAWRQIARLDPADGGHLLSKHFEGGAASPLALDLDSLPQQLELEHKLSRLTGWVLGAEQRELPYSMQLERQFFPAALGAAHRAACLRALALYGMADATEHAS
ncbi:DUF58 domain-containing protein [Janthinobacterium agaricidamnosum]|uniref:Uncharacterized protein n=1 Tax=Janthinobacterium agaricidamnosum NBRC 102515 = DSM 9628 TaxID=1349767 RepID=W0VBL0_9BURK|nr:DUF58 domain-containing protein [Janthinobacterium agaricidamnosum]CDG84677.1 conserved hypothetical protein [Janthinobacterium agaricidamnosum NBRC 102515 = DSM 9628]